MNRTQNGTAIFHGPYGPCPEYTVPAFARAIGPDGRIRKVRLNLEPNWAGNIDGSCRKYGKVTVYHKGSDFSGDWVYRTR